MVAHIATSQEDWSFSSDDFGRNKTVSYVDGNVLAISPTGDTSEEGGKEEAPVAQTFSTQ